ncbi:MAG: PspC domain-containing protein [Streptococcaceae bacterium]|jgi:phage shock protein PspC (stress-responsive transcriptional regulator)|nr:PspC domain-containing protein [Streptococcaceae bacterium]
MRKKLTKSNSNRWIFGVIGGLGEYFGLDESTINIIRIIYAIVFFVGIGSPFLLYLILALVIPKDRDRQDIYQRSSYDRPWENSSHNSSQSNKYGSNERKIKEAEPIKGTSDDWSDF